MTKKKTGWPRIRENIFLIGEVLFVYCVGFVFPTWMILSMLDDYNHYRWWETLLWAMLGGAMGLIGMIFAIWLKDEVTWHNTVKLYRFTLWTRVRIDTEENSGLRNWSSETLMNTWCEENAQGKFHRYGYYHLFSKRSDAILFKLSWQ